MHSFKSNKSRNKDNNFEKLNLLEWQMHTVYVLKQFSSN